MRCTRTCACVPPAPTWGMDGEGGRGGDGRGTRPRILRPSVDGQDAEERLRMHTRRHRVFCMVRVSLCVSRISSSLPSSSGNTLGTRYVPCQAASESIFSPSPTHSTPLSLSRPQRPSGPSYWNARPAPPHRRSSSSVSSSRATAPSYYTFFADRVAASPAHDRPRNAAGAPTSIEPRRGLSRPASPEMDYGYRWTASPQPISTALPIAESAAMSIPPPPLSPVFAPPPLPMIGRNLSQLRPASSTMRVMPTITPGFSGPPLVVSTPSREPVVELDADGVPIGEMDEPNSPDKEIMSWPGR